jgi:hypothetical protein
LFAPTPKRTVFPDGLRRDGNPLHGVDG